MTDDETIYCDNFSTMFLHPDVAKKMNEFEQNCPGNPSANSHKFSRYANREIEVSREKVAQSIGAKQNEMVFTSGATESDNLAIIGCSLFLKNITGKRTILVSSIEHPAVLESAESLKIHGFNIRKIKCLPSGVIDIDDLKSKLNSDVFLVSVMLVNNELGTIQPIKKVTELVHKIGAIMHTDASQALGKIRINVSDLNVDLMSLSSHKLGGPKGIGGLYIRAGPANFPIQPLCYGGGQESELRPGTLNSSGIVGFAEACAISNASIDEDMARIEKMRDLIEKKLLEKIPLMKINGKDAPRVAGALNFTISGINGDAFIANLKRVAMSTGSACKSGAPSPSHVLLSIGLSRDDAESTVRICLSSRNKSSQIKIIVDEITSIYEKLSKM